MRTASKSHLLSFALGYEVASLLWTAQYHCLRSVSVALQASCETTRLASETLLAQFGHQRQRNKEPKAPE